MAAVAKKCYYSNTSKIILFDFYSSFLNIIKIEFAWVLVRDLNISTDLIDKAKSAFTNNKLDVSLFEIVEHKDCVYDPPDVPSCN